MKKIISPFLFLLAAIIASCSDDDGSKVTCEGDVPLATVKMVGYEAIASWKPVPGDEYSITVEPKLAGVPDGVHRLASTDSTTTMYHYFMPATDYVFYLVSSGHDRVTCIDKNPVSFNTGCFSASSYLITAQSITSTKATLYWGDIGYTAIDKTDKKRWSPLNKFTVNLRKSGTVSTEVYGTDDHYYDIENLTPATSYEMQLLYVCTDGKTYSTGWNSFRTL